MSRQVGFALGIAVLVAVFTGGLPSGAVEAAGEGARAAGNVDPEVFRAAFADGFRVAALSVLLAVPFALTMRRRPADVQAAAAATAA
jgi:hypothetical protein